MMAGPWGELPIEPERPSLADAPFGTVAGDYDDWDAEAWAEWARNRPKRSATPDDELRECECPTVHGVIRHDRDTCTDPVAIRLDWFPV